MLTGSGKHNIRCTTKYNLYKTLEVAIVLYRCEMQTLLVGTERRIQELENKFLGGFSGSQRSEDMKPKTLSLVLVVGVEVEVDVG